MLNWEVVHRRSKGVPPVASAFKNCLMNEGASLIEAITHFSTHPGTRSSGAHRATAARGRERTKASRR